MGVTISGALIGDIKKDPEESPHVKSQHLLVTRDHGESEWQP